MSKTERKPPPVPTIQLRHPTPKTVLEEALTEPARLLEVPVQELSE